MEPNTEWSMEVGSWDFTNFGSHEEFVNFGGMDMESWDTYMSQSAELDCCVKTGAETEMVSSAQTQNEPMSFNTRNEIEAILRLDCHLCMHAFSSEKNRDRQKSGHFDARSQIVRSLTSRRLMSMSTSVTRTIGRSNTSAVNVTVDFSGDGNEIGM
jgi:hypothetical protein